MTHEPLRPNADSEKTRQTRAAKRYSDTVSEDVAQYLEARGLDGDTASKWLIGEVRDPIPAHYGLAGWISIPYIVGDHVAQVRFRRPPHLDGGPKYRSLPGAMARLFNVNAINAASDTIHVCEGEFDTILLQETLGEPCVGVPGANLWRPHYRRLFAGFQTVYVWTDPDKAGDELAATVISGVPGEARRVPLEADVTDTWVSEGQIGLIGRYTKAKEE